MVSASRARSLVIVFSCLCLTACASGGEADRPAEAAPPVSTAAPQESAPASGSPADPGQATGAGREVVHGAWDFDDVVVVGGVRTAPTALTGGDAPHPGDDGRVGAGVAVTGPVHPALPGDASYRFEGWDDGTPDDAAVEPDRSQVEIADRDYFNPQGRRFKVSVAVRPRTPKIAKESPNIVQKGRVDEGNTHQWKLSVTGNLTPLCFFRGARSQDSPEIVEVQVFGSAPLEADRPYQLACELRQGRAWLTVWSVGNGAPTVLQERRSQGAVPGIFVAPVDVVSVGKKPRDATSGDTYAGDIDSLVISRWEPGS